jgi:hypothetical protein
MKRTVVALLALSVLALIAGAGQHVAGRVSASSPGTTMKRLLSCPDVDGSGRVLAGDIVKVVSQYGIGVANPLYRFIDDLTADGNMNSGDITVAVQWYGRLCPLVDVQAAQATNAILNDPDRALLMACDVSTLAAHGYLRGSSDVPGQGIHYINRSYFDGIFDVSHPEGLVCDNGKLAAELYVIDGDVVGWLSGGQTSQPCPPATQWHADPPPAITGTCMSEDRVDIDSFCAPVPGYTCSWDGNGDGWHWHVDLCTVHVGGTSDTYAVPGMSESACHSFGGGSCVWDPSPNPNCYWDADVGWMGHFWNFQGNKNLVDENHDSTLDNGRFADCTPDGGNYKAFTCPQ